MNIVSQKNKKSCKVIFSLTQEELDYLNDVAIESRLPNRSDYIRNVLLKDYKPSKSKK